jgi:hypothetical protein
MRPVRVNKSLAAAVADGVALAQTLAGADNFLLNGSLVVNGVAVFDTPRRVSIDSVGDDSGIAFTVYGTNQGHLIQETVVGGNASAVQTLLDFETVTRVAASGATADDVTVGTNGVGSTPIIRTDYHLHTDISLVVKVTGTVNYSAFITYDDMAQDPSIPKTWWVTGLSAETANGVEVINDPVTGVIVVINSGDGAIEVAMIQGGLPQPLPVG